MDFLFINPSEIATRFIPMLKDKGGLDVKVMLTNGSSLTTSESDIDLMCKKESVFDFMDEIQDVINNCK
jgi:hypothetical protein